MHEKRERFVAVNRALLCVDEFGNQEDPAILLLAGATNSKDWWPVELCERLAAGQRRVLRVDYRDTGRSTTYPAGRPGYTFDDLAADVLRLLDGMSVVRAHLVGISMGGGLAQRVRLDYTDRVASLTLISTSPGLRPGAPSAFDLPPPAPRLLQALSRPRPSPDWKLRSEAIEAIVVGQEALAGEVTIGRQGFAAVAARAFDRTVDMASSMTNHWRLDPGAPFGRRLGEIAAPTLVVHGTADPLFSLAHGQALVRNVPNARLLVLDRVGHEVPPPQTWDIIVDAVHRHTAVGSWEVASTGGGRG